MCSTSLIEENALDLERVLNAAITLIGEKYWSYEDGLLRANLESLIKEIREKLCKTFAIKCMKSKNPRMNNINSKKNPTHGMDLIKYKKQAQLGVPNSEIQVELDWQPKW